MERILSRSLLQVCSKCYKDVFRTYGTKHVADVVPSSSRPAGAGILSSWPGVRGAKRSSNFFLLKRSLTSSGFQVKTPLSPQTSLSLRLIPQHSFLIRKFATEQSQPEKPLPSRKSQEAKGNSQRSPITWKNLIIIGVVGGVLLIGMRFVKQEKEEARKKAQNRKMGKAKLGGDWILTDHNGNLRSSKDFRGQWLLIYFGFTNCPDICPEEMEKIVTVIDRADVDSDLPKVQPIIITVDPLRDTPEALKEYCAEFSPRLLGFSGTEEQIDVATRAYRVYYSAGPKDEDNDYIVDHSIISYLVNPEGEFTEYFGQNKKPDEIYSSMKLHILSYMKKKAK